jgi:hypothetical protein
MEVGKMPAQRNTNQSRGLTTAGLIAVTAATLLMMAWAIFATPAAATQVSPVFFDHNPGCDDLGDPDLTSLTKFEGNPVTSGTMDGVTITVNDPSFDWKSQIGIDAVIVKGGDNANVYFYDEATSDTGLQAPINPQNDKPFGLSHIEFCIDEDVTTTTTTTTVPGGGGGGGGGGTTTTTTPPATTTTTTPPIVAPTTVHNTSTTAAAEVLPTTVRPGKLAFTGIEDVVPIGALALTLMTTGSGLLWAGSRRRRHDGSEDED